MHLPGRSLRESDCWRIGNLSRLYGADHSVPMASPQIATSVRCFVAIQKDKNLDSHVSTSHQLKKVISSLISPTF